MIIRTSKCRNGVLQSVANSVYKRIDFTRDNFPFCGSATEIQKALAASESWHVLTTDQPVALFKLEISGSAANISQICITSEDRLDSVVSALRQDLRSMRVTEIAARVAPNDLESLRSIGFELRESCVKFSRVPAETKMMLILPITNCTRKELPILAKLMYEAYAKTSRAIPDLQSAEELLHNIVGGAFERYLPDASFGSGAYPNIVSACLIVMDSPDQARIAQLFTHPLYRARGLATTEIAFAMNRLSATGVKSLTAWSQEGDDVVKRLLTKMGFAETGRAVEVSAKV